MFDRIEVWTVWRKVTRSGAALLDGFFNAIDFVNADIVQEHDIVFSQGRREALLDIGLECLAGHGSFQDKRGCHTIMAQRGDEGEGFPVSVRYFLDEPLALRRPTVAAGHRRGNAGFIEENQPFRIEPRLALLQRYALRRDIRPVLLGGVQAFF